ncbi:MAG: type II toxin-antitoxin system RelE/ParE family toxin [Candidatus Diapherotrites archaeon]|uniref:Type II toxin-antitoxin system RelE/ParE family toxin n=1 Tax=Candidatus Iainarchaeum sp. TaxID=3101447 RepID=A0A8T4L5S8_9ARCH|nr:type II toxin-antitoxin system RelE/ParE family toxin [Candidatus Diapherotrites archaeon]
MPFTLVWTNRAKKDLESLEKELTRRILDKMELFEKEDSVFLEAVKGTPYQKVRVGHYRVIVQKFPATKKIIVLRIEHRKKVYTQF